MTIRHFKYIVPYTFKKEFSTATGIKNRYKYHTLYSDAGSAGRDLIALNGNWSEVNVKKALLMGAVGALIGKLTGNGTQNTDAMNDFINAGKTWGSKAFLISAKEAMLHPNSGLVLQTMNYELSFLTSLIF